MMILEQNPITDLVTFFERSVDKYPDSIALICDDVQLSYQELDNQANQLAHYLLDSQIIKYNTIGVLLDRTAACYISILAILKIGAAYVPIETDYPDERINHIFDDMPFDLVITSSKQKMRTNIRFPQTILFDEIDSYLLPQPKNRCDRTQAANSHEHICYVIYTSGTTGKPKGVAVMHQSICHYVTVASNLYQISAKDVIYQGFSLAFDASLEEIWMAFANGATLVAATTQHVRYGLELASFLTQHNVSVLSTVPTLLANIEGEMNSLRLLILGGETCTSAILKRWARPGLKIINTYGPTEATVIATYWEYCKDKPISIGKPLPGYDIVILDEQLNQVDKGQTGELCIGGYGLAKEYINRPEITASKFIQDPRDVSKRLYRTGDLAHVNEHNELELAGRIDDQIKFRGFRIELNEIESVISSYSGVKQAVVSLIKTGTPRLVAYLLIEKKHAFEWAPFKSYLIDHLPAYMMPSLFEIMDVFPQLSSGKIDKKALPIPKKSNLHTNHKEPQTRLERDISEVWSAVLQQETISITADFFYDLGGHSLSAATIVSKLRKLPAFKNISLLDLYQNKTICQLAAKFDCIGTGHEPEKPYQKSHKTTYNATSTLRYRLCAIGQFFGCLLQYAISGWQLLAVILCYIWIGKHHAFISLQTAALIVSIFLTMPVLSLAVVLVAKWALLGKVKPGQHRLWGWFYFRWWLVLQLQTNISPAKHFMGSPLINLYCRLFGARIGKNCFIGSVDLAGHDLITIGDNTSVGYETNLKAYVVEDGWLKLGAITIGSDCFIGARSSLGINTVMEKNTALGDLSMLPMNARIPEQQRYEGSPASPVSTLKKQKPIPINASKAQTILYGTLHYMALLFALSMHYSCYLPSIYFVNYVYSKTHMFSSLLLTAPIAALFYLCLYFSLVIVTKKVCLNKTNPGRYPVKSFYYLRQWTLLKMLDIDEVLVLADSLYYPLFMKLLGAKIGKRVEMGEAPLVIPDLINIQDEGFIASSVAMGWPCINQGYAEFAPIHIDKRSFVGNCSYLPLGERIGDGGLLACLSIPPSNGRASEKNTAWLGSPAFYLPNREEFVGFSDEQTLNPSKKMVRTRLLIELIRIIMPSAFTLIGLFGLMFSVDSLLSHYSFITTALTLPLVECGIALSMVGVVVGIKWLIEGKLEPMITPLWDLFIFKNDIVVYWYSFIVCPYFAKFALGTPFISVLLRALGAKIGKYVYIYSDLFTEFDLIQIGDEVAINSGTRIQTHLYEDRIFKTSTIKINSRCSIGHASNVLYHTEMGEHSTLGNLSLLMKGEKLPENSSWSGCPAQTIQVQSYSLPSDSAKKSVESEVYL